MNCDIIIPVWDQFEFTRDCIESVIKNTTVLYRLIIIDNGSGEPTKKYLEGLKGEKSAEIIIARNDENIGFVKAVNQGIALSTAPYICLLNNDTIVIKDWLEIMIDAAGSSGDIGIVNPSSNTLGKRPSEGESIESYAEKLKVSPVKYVELGSAVGFCMLIKREVIDRIGAFDEIYGMGNFEDTDFSRRAIRDGYKSARAVRAYVYHREKASFGKRKTFEEDFSRNREIYEFRWGRPRRIAYVIESEDENILKRLEAESLKLARSGNWIYYLSKNKISVPGHSNIILWLSPERMFYSRLLLKVLTKKKRFDEIFVGNEHLGRMLEYLAFIHRAKVGYY